MIIVRYADDLIVGFQHEAEARCFLEYMVLSGCSDSENSFSRARTLEVGANLTATPYNLDIGTRDYFGNTLGTSINIGADGGKHPRRQDGHVGRRSADPILQDAVRW
jgi:hypothetical protein